MDVPQSSFGLKRLPAFVIALSLALASLASAQNRLRATTAAAFLKEPGGLRLATLVVGTSYLTGRTATGHIETTIEGWIAASSTSATTRDGFDLTVVAGGGESIRAAPGGAIIARVQEGTLLSKIGTRGAWIRVRRAGWVARAAMAAGEVVAATPAPAPGPQPPPPPPPPPPPQAATRSAAASPSPSPSSPVSAAARPAGDTARKTDASSPGLVSGGSTVRRGASVAGGPEGETIAIMEQLAPVEVVDRQRDWVKVRVEGWVRAADLAADPTTGPRVTGAMVREKPDRYLGQTVTWRLQYLAIQEADELRPEMPRGQPYVLARGPLPESGFVYLMLTKDQVVAFQERAPLDEVVVEAVIRAGRTKYLPTPVLSLVNVAR